ncbi:MAG: mechanosensitive ion channel family protein [Cyanobacteria bacterium P01_E01_bin.45]
MEALLEQIKISLLEILGQFIKLLPAIFIAVITLLLTRYAAKAACKVTQTLAEKTLKSRSLQSLFIQTSRISVWIGGIILASTIAFPDLQLGDIIGLLGLGSVAIGFAFQDIFKNFLAGVILLIQEPFKLGDQIVVDGFEGTVENIKIRSTRLKTYEGEDVEIPNSVIFTSSIRILTASNYRRTDLSIGVDYTTSLELAKSTFLETVTGVDGVLGNPIPEVDVVGFGDSSIDFKVRYWTKPQKVHVRRTLSAVSIALKNACDDAKITIPYPIRTLHYFDQQHFDESVSKNESR